MKRYIYLAIGYLAMVVLPCSTILHAQPAGIKYRFEPYELHSGVHIGQDILDVTHIVGFRGTVRKVGAPWLRVHFGEVALSESSYLLITSLKDGAQQRLNAVSLKQWNNSTAFFNGDEVQIELFVARGDKQVFFLVNRVMVRGTQ